MTSNTETDPINPIVRYAALVVFGPVFLAGELRSDPPFSNEASVLLAIFIGSLLWTFLALTALGLNPLTDTILYLKFIGIAVLGYVAFSIIYEAVVQ